MGHLISAPKFKIPTSPPPLLISDKSLASLEKGNREFKQRRFWATDVNRKWAFFYFKFPWRYQIRLLRVFTLVELICSQICLNLRLKSAKSPLLVDVHGSKTSLLKLLNEARHKNENHKTRFDKALFHERYYLWHGNARFSFKRGGT